MTTVRGVGVRSAGESATTATPPSVPAALSSSKTHTSECVHTLYAHSMVRLLL